MPTQQVYLVSIPLGIAKAVRDGSHFDLWTTTAILVGYAVPGFVLGVALHTKWCGVPPLFVYLGFRIPRFCVPGFRLGSVRG